MDQAFSLFLFGKAPVFAASSDRILIFVNSHIIILKSIESINTHTNASI